MNYCPAISGTIAYRWEIGVWRTAARDEKKSAECKKEIVRGF
jgi:hypothetical protein